MSLKPNSTFGRYRIDGPLGEGGMSTVYRAFEPGLDRHVALKILPSEFAQDKTFNERFDREAKMVARLDLLTHMLEERYRRLGVNYAQSLLFMNFLPVQ